MVWIGFSMMMLLVAPPPPEGPSTKPAGVNFIGLGIVLHGLAAGGNVWRASLAMKACPRDDEPVDVDATICRASNWPLLPVSLGTMSLNLGGIGMIATGSGLRAAWDFERAGPDSKRRLLPLFVSGGVLTAIGVASSIGLRAAMLATHRRFCDGDAFSITYGCRRGPTIGYFAGLQSSALLTSMGAGLLSYGWTYGSARPVRVAPMLGTDRAGLHLSGRF
jgi:hypothetical protein